MTEHRDSLRRKWFGLQPKETKRYLRKLDAMQNDEAERIEALIRSEKALNRQLTRELERKRSAVGEEQPESSEGLEDLLRSRLERSVEAVRRQGRAERASLLALLETKKSEQAERASELDLQLEDTRKAFDELLAEAARLIARLKDRPEESAALPLGNEELAEALAVLSEPVELSGEHPGETAEDSLSEQAGETAASLTHGANVIQFRLKSIISKLQAAENTERTALTADGAAAPARRMESAPTAASEDLLPQPDTAAPTAVEAPRPVRRKAAPPASAFWGDLHAYMTDQYEEPDLAAFKDIAAAREIGAEAAAQSASAQAEIGAVKSAQPATAPPAAPSTATSQPSNGAASAPPAAGADATSPALAEEIKAVQNRYIIGKAAGENLYGEGGALIIAKGALIGAETIEAAQRAGKMADLIVQMVIPGFEEQS